jgi:N-acylneuraminate cytidylyltransferase
MSAIAVIPARGGSRRIPRKNLKEFRGIPAVQRVVEILYESGIFGRIVVSTDDEEVAALARESGAEIPGMRPGDLADDYSPTIDVVRHVIDQWLGESSSQVALWAVYPTALLLSVHSLIAAKELFERSETDFLIPVLRYPHPVERRLRISQDGLLLPDEPASVTSRSQDLPPAFHDAGQFYVGSISSWQRFSPLTSGRNLPFEMPPHSAVDIDEPQHWLWAERLAELLES